MKEWFKCCFAEIYKILKLGILVSVACLYLTLTIQLVGAKGQAKSFFRVSI